MRTFARRVSASFKAAACPSARPSARHATANVAASSMPPHKKGDVSGVLAGVAVVGAVLGVGKMWYDASASTAPKAKTASAPQAAPKQSNISKDDVKGYLLDLKASLQELIKQIPEMDKAVREYMKENNENLTEEQLQQALGEQIFQLMESVEQKILESRGWDRSDFEQALISCRGDQDVQEINQGIAEIMQSVLPAQEEIELPEGLTQETMLEVVDNLINGMVTAMKETLAHAKEEGISDPAKALEEYQSIYLEQVQLMAVQLMKSYNLTQDQFTVALNKFAQENDEFRTKVEAMYAKQAEAFKNMGLPVQEQ